MRMNRNRPIVVADEDNFRRFYQVHSQTRNYVGFSVHEANVHEIYRTRSKRERKEEEEEGLGNTYGVIVAELKFETVGLALIERVGVHDLNVHQPGLEILGRDKSDARGQLALNLD